MAAAGSQPHVWSHAIGRTPVKYTRHLHSLPHFHDSQLHFHSSQLDFPSGQPYFLGSHQQKLENKWKENTKKMTNIFVQLHSHAHADT